MAALVKIPFSTTIYKNNWTNKFVKVLLDCWIFACEGTQVELLKDIKRKLEICTIESNLNKNLHYIFKDSPEKVSSLFHRLQKESSKWFFGKRIP